MKKVILDKVRFVCPLCEKDVELSNISSENDVDILEGLLTCSAGHQFPIVNGVAILVGNPSTYIKKNMQFMVSREDLNPFIFYLPQRFIPKQDSKTVWLNALLWAHYDDLPECDKKFFSPDISPRNTYARLAAHIPHNKDVPGIDIGCSVGRLTFELAGHVEYAIGVDYSFNSIRTAREIMKSGALVYRKRKEGTLFHEETKIDLSTVVTSNTEFIVADALNLPFANSSFGAATCFNLIDVVESPEKLLDSLSRILNTEGDLIIADSYHWILAHEKQEDWIGGKLAGKYSGLSKEAVKRALEDKGFAVDAEEDEIPWLLRIHDRAYDFYKIHLIEAHKTH